MIHRSPFFHADPSQRRGVKVLRIIGMTFVGVIFAALFALVFGFLVKWLWNFIMPAVFGLGTITYWQAFAIVILSKLLFGGFHGHSREHNNHFSRRQRDKVHDFLDIPHERPWGPGAEAEKWKLFTRYWQEKGKTDFQDYMRKMSEDNSDKAEEGKS